MASGKKERPATAGTKKSNFCLKCKDNILCHCKPSTSMLIKIFKERRAESARRNASKAQNVEYDDYTLRPNTKCLFYEIGEKDDKNNNIRSEINEARQTGILKLNRRHLSEIPDVVWSIDLVTDEDRKNVDVRFDENAKQPWWTYKSLVCLDLSFNCLTEFHPKGTAFYSLKELLVNNNSLKIISEELGKFQQLEVLFLNNNNITNLPESLCCLTNLMELYVQRNDLQQLPNKFGDLLLLKKLDISFNRINSIPFDIGYLTSLIELNMSHNKIELLPEEIQNLRALKILNVSNNCLSSIPNLNDMSHLVEFNGSSNMISNFPNFCGCRRLVEIQLQDNKITELIIENLQGVPLHTLVLSSNKIDEIPDDIFRISTLVLLDVSCNSISRLPYQLAQLRKLTNLKLDANPITDIRQDILRSGTGRVLTYLKRHSTALKETETIEGEDLTHSALYVNNVEDVCNLDHLKIVMRNTHCLILTDLKLSELSSEVLQEAKNEDVFRVDISKNLFTTIPEGLKELKQNLTEIIIRGNNLRAVPDFIGEMKYLLHFDVSNNKLDSLPLSMSKCTLMALIAECNCFTSIPDVVYNIKSLEHLNFRDNKISEIDVDNLKNLRRLYGLDLGNNCIEKVPPELGSMTQIKELYLHGNPFKVPRHDLLNKGTDAVMSYLRDKIAKHDTT